VLDTATNPGLAGSVFDAYLCLVEFSLYGAEPYEEIAGFARELRASADRAGAVRGAAFATTVLGEVELLSGRLDEAEKHLREADGLGKKSHADASRSLALERLAEVAIAAGTPELARAPLADALVLAQGSTLAGHLLPRIYGAAVRAAKDPAAASDVLMQAEGAFGDTPACTPCSIGFLIAAATSYARSGDVDRARSYVERAAGVASMWGESAWTAGVGEARAEVLIAEVDTAGAAHLLQEAAGLFARAGQPLDEARCRARVEEIS
jgi:ATP/maltotriose-dependent transcriptional regulator MalT